MHTNTTNNIHIRIEYQTNYQVEPEQAKNSIRELVADIKNNLDELYNSEHLSDLSEKVKRISENKNQYYESKFLGFFIKLFSKICNFKLHGEFKTSAQICAELADRMAEEVRRRTHSTVNEGPIPIQDPSEDSIENDENEESTVYYDMNEPSPEELQQLGIQPLVSVNQEIEDADVETDSVDSTNDDDDDEFFDMLPLNPEECERYGISSEDPSPFPNKNATNPDSPMAVDSDLRQESEELSDERTPHNEGMDLEHNTPQNDDDRPQELTIATTVQITTPVENTIVIENPPKSLKSTIIDTLNSGIAEADPTLGAWCAVIFHQIFTQVDVTDWRRNGENDYTITLNQEMIGHSPQLPGAGILNREFRVQFSTIEIDGETCPVINLPNGGIAQRTGSGWFSIDTHVYSMTVLPGREDIPNVRIATRLISHDVPANLVSDIWMDVEWNQ